LGCRRAPYTARSRSSCEVSESFVTVTHPFHPLAGQRLRVLFERKLATGPAVSCEGGPLGSLMLPLVWTDRGSAAASMPLSYEVLVELAAVVSAVTSRQAG
jgi:Family of unknown function (DUF5372)